jgi:uracil phosphoribosyltransferase
VSAVVLDHPLARHRVTLLRDRTTETRVFRRVARELARMVCYEGLRGIEAEACVVDTPLARASGVRVRDEDVVVVPVLRAGVGMLEGVLDLLPSARVGFLGVQRDEQTLQPVPYYAKLPEPVDGGAPDVVVLDPMIATGGSASHALAACKRLATPRSLRLLALIAAPQGLERVAADHPDVAVTVAALDDGLDDRGFIVPGLGDAGDRIYGTW